MRPYLCFFLILLTFITACSQESEEKDIPAKQVNKTVKTKNSENINYENLQKLISYGQANLHEVRQALTQPEAASLSNSINATFAMRWHRGVIHLLNGAWQLDQKKYPELAWEQLSKAPARIALASTINRIRITGTDEYLAYIRSYKYDEHEFNRAQVSIALGFNGAVQDIDYLKEMANGDNHYVIQSAITALGLMGGKQARNALVDLWKEHRGTNKGELVEELLLRAYNVIPSTEKQKDSIPVKSN